MPHWRSFASRRGLCRPVHGASRRARDTKIGLGCFPQAFGGNAPQTWKVSGAKAPSICSNRTGAARTQPGGFDRLSRRRPRPRGLPSAAICICGVINSSRIGRSQGASAPSCHDAVVIRPSRVWRYLGSCRCRRWQPSMTRRCHASRCDEGHRGSYRTFPPVGPT
jgi:hypothetical protein